MRLLILSHSLISYLYYLVTFLSMMHSVQFSSNHSLWTSGWPRWCSCGIIGTPQGTCIGKVCNNITLLSSSQSSQAKRIMFTCDSWLHSLDNHNYDILSLLQTHTQFCLILTCIALCIVVVWWRTDPSSCGAMFQKIPIQIRSGRYVKDGLSSNT